MVPRSVIKNNRVERHEIYRHSYHAGSTKPNLTRYPRSDKKFYETDVLPFKVGNKTAAGDVSKNKIIMRDTAVDRLTKCIDSNEEFSKILKIGYENKTLKKGHHNKCFDKSSSGLERRKKHSFDTGYGYDSDKTYWNKRMELLRTYSVRTTESNVQTIESNVRATESKQQTEESTRKTFKRLLI